MRSGHPTQWPFTARDAEFRELVRLLDGPAATVFVSGPAGAGKSRLAAEVLAELGRRGWTTAAVHATSALQPIPYGAFSHLLPAAPTPEAGNPLRWAADLLCRGPRYAVLVDDVALLDPASAALLHHLARRGRAAVLATLTAGAPVADALSVLWRNGHARRVELTALDETGVARILAAALPGAVPVATSRRLWQLTRGHLPILHETVLAALESGALAGPPWRQTAAWPVTAPRLRELVDVRIGTLDEAETAVLEYLGFAEPLALAELVRLCGEAAIERCAARELIHVGDRVCLAHPIFGAVARARCPATRRRRRHLDLLSTAAGTDLQTALWQREAGVAAEPGPLLAACRLAWAVHDHDAARRLGAAAVEAGGGADAAILVATVLSHANAYEEAAAILETIPAGLTERQRAELAMTRSFVLAPADLAAALAVLAEAGKTVESPRWRQNLELNRALLRSRDGDLTAVLELTERIAPATPALHAQVLSARSGALALTGKLVQATALAELALQDVEKWCEDSPALVLLLCANLYASALYAGDVAAAGRSLTRLATETAGSLDWVAADNFVLQGRAQVARMRGRLDEAAALARTADSGPAGPSCTAEYAHALALAGHAGPAREALALARSRASTRFVLPEHHWLALAEPWVTAAEGRLDQAIEQTLAHAAECAARGIAAFEAVALHDAVRLGAPIEASARLHVLAGEVEGPLTACYARHARALAEGDGAGLLAVAGEFERLQLLLYAAEAAAQAAEASGGRTVDQARTRAWLLAGRCEHPATPALATLRAPGLTKREHQIAELAAAGQASKEIAADLTLSVRTVENHLHAAYTKLGVTNRTGLRGLLSRDPGP